MLVPKTASIQVELAFKWGVDSKTLGFWQPRQPSKTRRGWPVSRPLWHEVSPLMQKVTPTIKQVPLFPPFLYPLSPTPPSPSLRTPCPTVPGRCRPPRVRPPQWCYGAVEGPNCICCHLPKLPGAHVCSGYR